jgi:hypothetical protein
VKNAALYGIEITGTRPVMTKWVTSRTVLILERAEIQACEKQG